MLSSWQGGFTPGVKYEFHVLILSVDAFGKNTVCLEAGTERSPSRPVFPFITFNQVMCEEKLRTLKTRGERTLFLWRAVNNLESDVL